MRMIDLKTRVARRWSFLAKAYRKGFDSVRPLWESPGWYPYMIRTYIREWRLLRAARQRHEQDYLNLSERPLVSVTIATYNQGQMLTERTLPSVLSQTYQNLEIVIVGDHCTDDTEERLRAIGDPRIRFVNLPERGPYPEDPELLWLVAGTEPANKARELARGKWIAYFDHDDVMYPWYIETLLDLAQRGNYEFVYGQMDIERSPGVCVPYGGLPFGCGTTPHSATLHRAYLRLFEHNGNAYKYRMPGDGDMFERMAQVGVRVGFIKRPVYRMVYRESSENFNLRRQLRFTVMRSCAK